MRYYLTQTQTNAALRAKITHQWPERFSGSLEFHPSLAERGLGAAFRVTGKHGATFLCVVADCEHVIEPLALELIHLLRAMTGNINAKLFHNCNCFDGRIPANVSVNARAGSYRRIGKGARCQSDATMPASGGGFG